ncbi:MAG: hypothetical protein JW791_01845 [Nanoarchaeota archaeon]|nr:hypothetical protein [Nanoarchaeota archaeon]
MSSNNEGLTFHVIADNKEELEKLVADTISAEEKRMVEYGIEAPERKRVMEYCVLIKDEKRATGNSIEEAIENAKTTEPKMTIKATIKYNLSQEEVDKYNRKKKPSSAEPFEAFSFTNDRF